MEDDEFDERTIETLVEALAAQVAEAGGGGLSPRAVKRLQDAWPPLLLSILSVIGHRLHYLDADEPEAMAALACRITEVLRESSQAGPFGVRPGDEVVLAADADGACAGDRVTLRYVSEDGTLHVQPSPVEDFVIFTVPFNAIRPPT